MIKRLTPAPVMRRSVIRDRASRRPWSLLRQKRTLRSDQLDFAQLNAVDELKKAIEGRIQALANVHSLFVASRWIGAELTAIAKQELAPYAATMSERLQMDGPQVLLEPNAAQASALILHELATNAVKYGLVCG